MVSLTELRDFAKYHLVRRVHDHPAPESKLGVQLLPFDGAAYARALRRERKLPFEIEELALLRYRDRAHPMHLVTSRVAREPRRRLLVLAGVHGNEHAGTLAIPELLDALEPDELAAVELRIVTPVNPVGSAEGSRYNADGFDINRDFLRFETEEARMVRRVFDAARPDLVLSLHEGPHAATFLFANRLVARDAALAILSALQSGGTDLAERDYFHRHLDPPGYAPMSRAMWLLSLLWARTLGMMATATWAHDRGVPEITLETSWRCPDGASRIAAHVTTIRAALGLLA
jgi:hypothetical protein